MERPEFPHGDLRRLSEETRVFLNTTLRDFPRKSLVDISRPLSERLKSHWEKNPALFMIRSVFAVSAGLFLVGGISYGVGIVTRSPNLSGAASTLLWSGLGTLTLDTIMAIGSSIGEVS